MKNSKLIDILLKFNPSEIERLKAFMVSPYFIKQKSLVEFGSMVLNQYPHFEGDKVNEKTIYAGIYPGQKFNPQTVHDLMTQMISSIHSFLSIENFLKEDVEIMLRLMEELRIKDAGREFMRIGTKLSRALHSVKKDNQYYYYLMRYEDELDIYYILSKGHRNYSKNMSNKADALDNYYLASKLKLACEIINRQNVFSSEYHIELLEEVLGYVTKNIGKFENAPAVNIYYRIFQTLTNPEEENHFQDLKLALEHEIENFSHQELREMYNYAQNYCIKKLNSGHKEYVSELFQLYHKLLDTGIIYENNYLSQWDYKNITSIGLRLNEFDWIENFIHAKKMRIHPDFREIAYTYNLANFYYEKKEFKSALKTLNSFNNALKQISDTDFDDPFYNIDTRTMLLKIYYELGEDEPLRAIIESFKLFLVRNKKITDRQRNIYLNLIKYTKKLNEERQKYQLNPGKDSRPFFRLKNEIELEKNMANITWLQSQVLELETEIGNTVRKGR